MTTKVGTVLIAMKSIKIDLLPTQDEIFQPTHLKTWQLPAGIPIGLTDHEETESYAQDVQTHLRARK